MKVRRDVQLAHLVDMESPDAVFEEVKYNFIHHYDIADFFDIRVTFSDFLALYDGKYSGYKACNTNYHDKTHIIDVLLAISRLIDGYNIKHHKKLPVDKVKAALMATILHDSGYIQTKNDKNGTGAKYTLSHVDRSVNFIKKYFEERYISKTYFDSAKNMIHCTGLGTDIKKIQFQDKYEKELGFMLGAADLLGQMSSRNYLEKLIYLYHEFREGNVKGFKSTYELLKNTLSFYSNTKKRLADVLQGVDKYAEVHFKKRYKVKENLYRIAIKRQMDYLEEIVRYQPNNFKFRLRRKVSSSCRHRALFPQD